MARVAAGVVDPAGRLHRRRGAAAGDAAIVPGLSAAAGVLRVSAALSLLRADGTGARRSSRVDGERGRAGRFCSAAATRRSRASSMRSNLALFCTPAVNLFEKRARSHSRRATATLRVPRRADRTRPLDFEIYEVTDVVGHGVGDRQRAAVPAVLFGLQQRRPSISSRRTSRRAASRGWCPPDQKRRGPRSSYIGSEVFLSLVDSTQAPYSAAICGSSRSRRCAPIAIWCCRCRSGIGQSDFSLDVAAPVTSVRVVSGPSRPYAPLADGAIAWRAISHLSLNYLSLVQSTRAAGGGGAARSARAVRAERPT